MNFYKMFYQSPGQLVFRVTFYLILRVKIVTRNSGTIVDKAETEDLKFNLVWQDVVRIQQLFRMIAGFGVPLWLDYEHSFIFASLFEKF